MLYVLGGILALAVGIYVGAGMPGLPGREDRVVPPGREPRQLAKHEFLDWLRPKKHDDRRTRKSGRRR